MIKQISAAVIAVALTLPSVNAGELADACVAALEADGRDSSGCSCLEAELEGNDGLIEEMFSLGEISDPDERYAAASDDAKAVMDTCTR